MIRFVLRKIESKNPKNVEYRNRHKRYDSEYDETIDYHVIYQSDKAIDKYGIKIYNSLDYNDGDGFAIYKVNIICVQKISIGNTVIKSARKSLN